MKGHNLLSYTELKFRNQKKTYNNKGICLNVLRPFCSYKRILMCFIGRKIQYWVAKATAEKSGATQNTNMSRQQHFPLRLIEHDVCACFLWCKKFNSDCWTIVFENICSLGCLTIVQQTLVNNAVTPVPENPYSAFQFTQKAIAVPITGLLVYLAV